MRLSFVNVNVPVPVPGFQLIEDCIQARYSFNQLSSKAHFIYIL